MALYGRLTGIVDDPPRPPYVDRMAFWGGRFAQLDAYIHEGGFTDDGTNPAVVHVPVFLYGRSDKNFVTAPSLYAS